MSREVKYIGMDVHKEAVVIAVLNGTGTQGMESIVETEASSILRFIDGLGGELHVTWEEGSWATWLYDLLKPTYYAQQCCGRSITENMDRARCLSSGSEPRRLDSCA